MRTSSSIRTTSSSMTSSSIVIPSESKIYFDGPEGVEVYLDGSYVGIAPTSCKKVTGSHVVTLRKDDYQTKSYTVTIEDDGNSITFSFSELVKETAVEPDQPEEDDTEKETS